MKHFLKEKTLASGRKILLKKNNVTVNQSAVLIIAEKVRKYFYIEKERFYSSTRKREVVQARQIAMHIARRKTKFPTQLIGSIIGNKDHATVLHACKTVNNLMDTDKKYNQIYCELWDSLQK